MPQLPDQQVFTQGAYASQDIPVNPAAFGATVGPALQNASNEFSDIALKRQQIWNEKTNNDALNGLMNDQSKLLTKYKSLQGDDAVNSLDDYRKQLNDTVGHYRSNLNPAAQRLYDQTATRILRYNMDSVDSHWDQQFKTATLTSNASSISLQKQRAANAANPREFADALQQIQDLSARHADLVGIHGDAQTEFTNAHLGEAYALAITKAQGDNEVGKAQGLLEAGKPYLGANYDALVKSTDRLNADLNSLAQARDIYKSHGGNINAMDNAIFNIQDKNMRSEVWKYAHEMYAADAAQRTQYKMEAQSDLAQRMADQTAELTAGVLPKNPIKQADMERAGLNPKQIQHYQNTLSRAANYGTAVQQSAFTTPEQDVQLQAQNRPTADGEGFALQQEMSESLDKVIKKKYEDLKTDPAGYVMKHAPEIQESFSAAFSDPAKLPTAFSKLTAYYDQLGLPANQRPMLPSSVAQEYAKNISSMDPLTRVQYLQQLSQKVGPAYIGATSAQLAKTDPMIGLQTVYSGVTAANGENVGALLARGSDLLYGRSDAEGKPLAKPVFKMEEKDETRLKSEFESQYGASYSGRSDVRDLDFAAIKAIYATYSDRTSKTDFDQTRFNAAASAYYGTKPTPIGASSVLPPYGVDSGYFRQQLNANVERSIRAFGGDDSQVRRVLNHGVFTQVGSDLFTASAPDAKGTMRQLEDAHGRPLVFSSNLNAKTPRPKGVATQPADAGVVIQ